MRKDIKDLKERVREEATILRDILTQEEKNKLDFDTFDSLDRNYCIYGQATGDCYSSRASELIEQACQKVYNPLKSAIWEEMPLNGSPKNKNRNPNNSKRTEYYSPIELFIGQPENVVERCNEELENEPETNNCENLLKFIKCEVDELIFE